MPFPSSCYLCSLAARSSLRPFEPKRHYGSVGLTGTGLTAASAQEAEERSSAPGDQARDRERGGWREGEGDAGVVTRQRQPGRTRQPTEAKSTVELRDCTRIMQGANSIANMTRHSQFAWNPTEMWYAYNYASAAPSHSHSPNPS